MKTFALLVSLFISVSCAEYSGASYAANGNKTGEYMAKTFMTDLGAGKFTKSGAVVANQNQTKVALSAIRTAGTVATTIAAANALADQTAILSTNSTKEVLGAQQAGTAAAKIKSDTALGLGAQSVEKVKILNPVPGP
jgi:hypothetical protein